MNGTNSVGLQAALACDPRQNLAEHEFLNPACFVLPAPGANGPIILPEQFGPGFITNDLSAFKNFKIREGQLRFNSYNFLNHPVWSFTNNDTNLSLAFNSAGKLNNANFGYTTNKVGRRIVQVAVKYYF